MSPTPANGPVSLPPLRPVMIFDGDCRFCRLWIERWRGVTGDRVEYLPQQDPSCATRFPGVDSRALQKAVHLVEADGRVTRGAEACARALATNPRWAWGLTLYERQPILAGCAEGAYALVARHRTFFSGATRLLWGDTVRRPGWWFSRELFLTGLALIHLVAFVSLWVQIDGLIGPGGILPADTFFQRAGQQLEGAGIHWDRYRILPTLCWWSASGAALHGMCLAGVLLSLAALAGWGRAPAFVALWALYLSLVVAGQDFLSFQWDVLLLEATFLAVFWTPWVWGRRAAREAPSSALGRWLIVWLLFRLMFESGLVKVMSGDRTWQDLTALQYHYWTQPLPGPLSWHVHQLPAWVHRASCAMMFAAEILLPCVVWAPRRLRLFAFHGLVALQGAILVTGNYTFFNGIALLLCLVLVDDDTWRRWFHRAVRAPAQLLQRPGAGERWRERGAVVVVVLSALIGGTQVVGVFFPRAERPTMSLQRWLAPFRTFNGYGLFAVMTTERPEIVVEGSADGVLWKAYAFRYKLGDVLRRPSQVAPHQPRLDWQMWFAALGDVRQNPWFVNFCFRLLEGSAPVLALMGDNPFPDAPPLYVRARRFDYRFSTPEERQATGAWWVRQERGLYCPPLSLKNRRD